MDNISHSLPRQSFSNGGAFFASHNSVYDDVFGGPRKFDIPTLLAPRADDYSEIFCTSRSSSCIPFLQLPIISDHSNRSPSFDYTEVFGDFGAFAVTPSFHDLLAHDDEEEDSSHEPWSPAQSGSLSDEVDPLNGSDKSYRLSDVDVHQSFESIKHFNASYNKSTQRNSETVLTGTARVTNFCAVPGYTFSPCESSVSWNGEDEHCSVDLSPLEKPGIYTSPQDKPFKTVSDISLRTKPSRLPPPSRPPPALVVEKRECDRSNSKIKSSKSYAFDRVVDDGASLFIDVEVDATISAVGTENKNNRVKHESTKEETSVSVPVTEDRIGSTKGTEETSGIGGVQHHDSADNSALDVAWKEETEYFEVIEKNISKQAFDMVENYNTSTRLMNRDSYRNPRMINCDIFNQKEDSKKFKATKEAPKWDEERNQLEMTTDDHCERGNKQQQEMQNTRLIDQKRFPENVKLSKLAHLYDFDMPIPKNFQQLGDCEMLEIDYSDETVEELKESKGNVTAVEARLKASPKGMDIRKRYVDARVIKQSSGKHQQNILREECERGHEDVKGADTRERVKKTTDPEGAEKQHNGVPGKENESKLKETHELKENFMILKEAMEHVESVNKSCIAAEHEKNENGELACGVHEGEERFMEADKQKVNEFTFREALAQARNEKEIKLIHKTEVTEERNRDASKPEHNHLIFRLAETEIDNKGEVFETKGNASLSRDVEQEDLEIEPTKTNGHEREVKWDMDGHILLEGARLKVLDEGCQLQQTTKTKVLEKHELLDGNTHSAANITIEFPCLHNEMRNSNNCGSGVGVTRVMAEKKSFEVEESHEPEKIISTKDDGGQKMKTQFISKRVDSEDSFTPCEVIRDSLIKGRKVDDASSVLKHSDGTLHSLENSTTQRIERKDKNIKDSIAVKDRKVEERVRRQAELENEHIRKVEEEREREREREKDRMAVNKAALERSYIEARERTERAAVERATAEVRQRAMAGARERLEKTSMEAKHRVERAAVERANAEARQRAVEKSMAQKVASDTRDRVETSFPDRFPASFKSDTMQSSLSSDLHFQTTAISNGLRYSSSSAHVVAEGESPQRCKARLERYRRTAERAANALAEKNRRDLLAQREREERNRVAESLDAELKRWSNGKGGNLRALLSTLQYILGPDSGWQPVPLTEVITTASVKKAYRKATLFVHPDKLQQRGATIQQKYICEKVFDLLKEAWNKFNSEER